MDYCACKFASILLPGYMCRGNGVISSKSRTNGKLLVIYNYWCRLFGDLYSTGEKSHKKTK